MPKIIICLLLFLFPLQLNAQMSHISAQKYKTEPAAPAAQPNYSADQNTTADSTPSKDAETKEPRLSGYLKDYGDQRKARNIMVVAEVANYKLGDEKLEKEFENLKHNKEFLKKIKKITENLDNGKYPDSKNRTALNILQEAGNKLYNLLAD